MALLVCFSLLFISVILIKLIPERLMSIVERYCSFFIIALAGLILFLCGRLRSDGDCFFLEVGATFFSQVPPVDKEKRIILQYYHINFAYFLVSPDRIIPPPPT